MKHVMLAGIVSLALAAPVRADVKLTESVGGKGVGMSGSMPVTTYIKGLKLRSDSTSGDTVRTTIFDVENQKMYIFDSKKKEADVWDMADFGKQLGGRWRRHLKAPHRSNPTAKRNRSLGKRRRATT